MSGGGRRRAVWEALATHVRWHEAEQDIRDYLAAKGCDAARIQKEVDAARPFLEPWLI
jgi:hypothetical protein